MKRAFCLALLLALMPLAGAQTPDRATEELRAEMVFWESIRSSTDPADFRAYLEQYPRGRFAALARNRLAALAPQPAAPAAAPPTAPAASIPQAAPQPASRGPLAAGDTWTYRVTRRGAPASTQEVTLVSAGAHVVTEEIHGDGATQRAEHRRGAYLMPAGSLSVLSPYLAVLSPSAASPGVQLRVDNLDSRTCNAGWSCALRARVVGRDRVQVPAGTFDATRVEITQSWTSPSQTNDRGEMVSRTMTVWYAPEVKRAVKVASRGGESRYVDTQYEVELTSYQLK